MNLKLTIGWLYPDLMNIYGDRGNILILQKRCEWRGIETDIKNIDLNSKEKDLASCDLLMMGGAQDAEQAIVAKDLIQKKKTLSAMIENGVPGLYICGGFQYLGKYYQLANGEKIEQLGILDIYTENPGKRRLIGNIAITVNNELEIEKKKYSSKFGIYNSKIIFVGFENHGGRTKLGLKVKPLGKVIYGYGSNDEAKEEGAVYKNTIGTYFHGPILSKNPELADFLITKALEKKYKKEIKLQELDDSLVFKAREIILKKISVI